MFRMLEDQVSGLEKTLDDERERREALQKKYDALELSYATLLDTNLQMRLEALQLASNPPAPVLVSTPPPIFCPDCKKRRRKATGRPPKDPCDCVLP